MLTVNKYIMEKKTNVVSYLSMLRKMGRRVLGITERPKSVWWRKQKKETSSFAVFVSRRVEILKEQGRYASASNMQTALRSLMSFSGCSPLAFSDITPDKMQCYQEWLLAKGVRLNTISCYMRSLRSAYSCAVREGLTKNASPFSTAYTKVGETTKRSIPLKFLQRMQRLSLEHEERLALARDLFLFSFYMRGMSFVDIAYLRREQIRNGYIVYRRHKTGKEIRIRIETETAGLLCRYGNAMSEYAFPILTAEDAGSAHRQYRSKECYYNKLLKIIAERIGLSTPLSFYCARHTWASLAFRHRTDIGIISEALGHHSLKTTLIYIKSIESDEAVNEINRKMIGMILK